MSVKTLALPDQFKTAVELVNTAAKPRLDLVFIWPPCSDRPAGPLGRRRDAIFMQQGITFETSGGGGDKYDGAAAIVGCGHGANGGAEREERGGEVGGDGCGELGVRGKVRGF